MTQLGTDMFALDPHEPALSTRRTRALLVLVIAVLIAATLWPAGAALALGTLVSEDLACIAAGELARRGQMTLMSAIAWCFLGIWLGDLGLFAVGRMVGPGLLSHRWLTRRLRREQVERFGQWFDRNGAAAIMASRFLPGTRLPMYVGAGMLAADNPDRSFRRFALFTALAAAAWTPLIVLTVAAAGDAAVGSLDRFLGQGWALTVPVLVVGYGLIRIAAAVGSMLSATGRAKLAAGVSKLWRWEFWPMWAFYLPVIGCIAWLVIRHRSFTVITAANPGIRHGGFVGESKFDILRKLSRSGHVIATAMIGEGPLAARCRAFERLVTEQGWSLPMILKPDIGERGTGVKLVGTFAEANTYLARVTGDVIAQAYHPGPFEAGVFYYRDPQSADRIGRILSITDKHFPTLCGDGQSTLEQLIWAHPRFRMQARTFLARHAADCTRVLAAGEAVSLAVAGNHCQGALFCDGSHLITPQLEAAIDRIARSFVDDGFHFGRFDVRYTDVEQFKAGEDLVIVELNGITSESTNVYDPSWSLVRAYRTLFCQWRILFEIGAANRRAGVRPSSLGELAGDVFRTLGRGGRAPQLSD